MRPFDPALLRHVPAARLPVLALGVLGVVTGALAIAQAVTLAWLVTVIATGGPMRTPALLLLGLLIARGVLSGIAEVVAGWAGQRVASAVRSRLLRRWLRLPEEDRPASQEAVTRVTEGVASIEPYVARYLPALVSSAVVPVLTLLTLLVVDVWSALIVVFTLPLLPLFAALIGQHTRDETQRRWAAMEALAGHFLDVVRGLPTLVTYGRAQHQAGVVHEVGQRHRRATVRALRTAFLSTAALELLATISVAMVAVGVGLRLAVGWMDLQVALTAILLAPEAYWPIRRVGAEFHTAADGASALDALHAEGALDVHAEPPTAEPRAGSCTCTLQPTQDHDIPAGSCTCTLQPPDAPRSVGVAGLRYAHADREPVLDRVDLHTPAGPGLTVLTGASGVGKSTLLDLLAGLRRPAAGTVTMPAAVHYATQRPLLTPGTVLDNLRLGAPDLTDGEARAALGAVGLWEDLAPRQGLHTVLGDDGFGLSAGQRARLALARATLSDAPVVLLDEPTAHVAAAALPRLHEVVLSLASRHRVVVATHDITLAAMADDRWVLAEAAPPEAAPPEAALDLPVPEPTGTTGVAPPTIHRRARLACACLLGGLATSCGVALTATSGWLIVQASTGPVILTLLVAIVGVRAFGIGRPVLRYAERIVSHDVALAELADRRTEVYRRLIPLTPARLGRRSRAEVLTAVVADLDDVIEARVRVTVPLWSTALASAVAAAIVGIVLPAAGAVLVLGALTAYGIGLLGQRTESPAHTAAVQARGRSRSVGTTLAGQLSAFRAVLGDRMTGALDGLEQAQRQELLAVLRLTLVRGAGSAATWLLVGGTALLLAGAASRAYAAGLVSAPVAALVVLTPLALAEAWTSLPEVFGHRARARAASQRLDTVLGQRPAVTDREHDDTEPTPGPGLELEQVSARWGETAYPDLLPVDLDLGPAARVLLTGPNGSGKSTLLAVLARHLDPWTGTYRWGGTDVRGIPIADLRSRLAVVDDEPHAFAGSVRANLLLARPNASDEDLRHALDTVGLADWLARLPEHLDTTVRGLSGGERTRLALARAVLSQRPVLLLDEPTAHLDQPTARTVLCRVLAASIGRSIVMVSHDPAAVVLDRHEWKHLDLDGTGPTPVVHEWSGSPRTPNLA